MNRKRLQKLSTSLRDLPWTNLNKYEADVVATIRELTDAILEDAEGEPIALILHTQLLDIQSWSRIGEIRNYARFHDISFAEAIERLVNSGLSHEHRGWTS